MISTSKARQAQERGRRHAKDWITDTRKTGRPWPLDRILSISRLNAKYSAIPRRWREEYVREYAIQFAIALRNADCITMDEYLEMEPQLKSIGGSA